MNYYIAIIDEYEEEWVILSGNDYDKMLEVFKGLCIRPGHVAELRETEEDLDTHLDYTVIDIKEEIKWQGKSK